MGDIVDLFSLVSSSRVRVIDFRVFVSICCGLDLGLACSASAPERAFVEEFPAVQGFVVWTGR